MSCENRIYALYEQKMQQNIERFLSQEWQACGGVVAARALVLEFDRYMSEPIGSSACVCLALSPFHPLTTRGSNIKGVRLLTNAHTFSLPPKPSRLYVMEGSFRRLTFSSGPFSMVHDQWGNRCPRRQPEYRQRFYCYTPIRPLHSLTLLLSHSLFF